MQSLIIALLKPTYVQCIPYIYQPRLKPVLLFCVSNEDIIVTAAVTLFMYGVY